MMTYEAELATGRSPNGPLINRDGYSNHPALENAIETAFENLVRRQDAKRLLRVQAKVLGGIRQPNDAVLTITGIFQGVDP